MLVYVVDHTWVLNFIFHGRLFTIKMLVGTDCPVINGLEFSELADRGAVVFYHFEMIFATGRRCRHLDVVAAGTVAQKACDRFRCLFAGF